MAGGEAGFNTTASAAAEESHAEEIEVEIDEDDGEVDEEEGTVAGTATTKNVPTNIAGTFFPSAGCLNPFIIRAGGASGAYRLQCIRTGAFFINGAHFSANEVAVCCTAGGA